MAKPLTPEDLTDGQDPMTYAEIAFLRRLTGWVQPAGIIVNIGADRGISSLVFLSCTTAVVFSIDMLPCPNEKENALAALEDPTRIIRLLGRSQEIGLYWPWMVDMVFVDGDHSEAGVRGDDDAWAHHIKPGGIIAFHDYMKDPPPNNPSGAFAAVNAFMRDDETHLPLGIVDRLIAFRITEVDLA